MGEAPLIVGVSGLRGIVGKSFTPEVTVRYAAAFGTWLRERGDRRPGVLVCRDGRAFGEMFLHAVAAGLQGVGCDVTLAGVLPTPSAGFAAACSGCDAAIIVTASHNPGEWNGLKIVLCENGVAFAPDAGLAGEIVRAFQEEKVRHSSGPARVLTFEKWHTTHLGGVEKALFGLEPGRSSDAESFPRRVVLDSVNASGSRISKALLDDLNVGHTVQLHGDDSGVFPHDPEPTAENLSEEGGLCDVVPGLKADIGFAQDPDADRLAIVDETGRYIGEEYTLVLCAEALLSGRREEPAGEAGGPPAIVVNLSTSRMIDDLAARHGAEVFRTPVGEANVVDKMRTLAREGRRVVLGGEGNGGVIWPEVVHIRDSLSAMALVLYLMRKTGKKVSELVADIDALAPGGRGYAIVKRKQPLASKEAAGPTLDRLVGGFASERIDRQDGVRIDFDPAGFRAGVWLHVRPSNTEPIMRLICEAPAVSMAEAVLEEAAALTAQD